MNIEKNVGQTMPPTIEAFLANVPILYPLKTTENQRFSGVFRGCKMGTLARNGSMTSKLLQRPLKGIIFQLKLFMRAWGQMGCKKKYTTHVRSIFHLKRNQLIYLQWKPIDRFLHEYNINLKLVNKIYKDFLTF